MSAGESGEVRNGAETAGAPGTGAAGQGEPQENGLQPTDSRPTAVEMTDENNMQENTEEGKTIVEIASENEQFSTLATAITEAGLVETLSSDGPFTVFAPTNAAFEKLPEGTLESLLADPDQLTAVLTYHVVPGELTSDQVVELDSAETVQGSEVEISTSNGTVMVDGAQVIQADIQASNGVIHVIDSVIIPE